MKPSDQPGVGTSDDYLFYVPEAYRAKLPD